MDRLLEFQQLWDTSHAFPDLSHYLENCGELSAAELAAIIHFDLEKRWEQGGWSSASDYLASIPKPASELEAIRRLVEAKTKQLSQPSQEESWEGTDRKLFPGQEVLSSDSEYALPQLTEIVVNDSELDRICDQFEAEFRGERVPSIESYLALVPDGHREKLFRWLLPVELWWLRKKSVIIDREKYVLRFAQFASAVDDVWNQISGSESSHSTIGPVQNLSAEIHHSYESVRVDSTEPRFFGDYQVLAKLGSGTFGCVYKARHVTNGNIVAIKVLMPCWTDDPVCEQAMRQQFAVEAQTMLKFDHPNIVKVISMNDVANPPYLIQEFIDGQTLRDRLKCGRIPLAEAIQYAIQIADGLTHMHAREKWHRDLKPENILLDRHNIVHIADFGLALDNAQRWHQRDQIAGTFHYMAPEQLRGRTHLLNARCDLWAFGVVLYEMLVGRRPFSGDREQIKTEIFERTPPAPRELDRAIPRGINRICMQCLSKRDVDRPDAAANLADDLREELQKLISEPSEFDGSSLSKIPGCSEVLRGNIPSEADLIKSYESPIESPVPTLRKFKAEHARFVLERFGIGLKRLDYPLTEQQQAFLTAAVALLVESDRDVLCVRLVVLASVMEDRPWTLEELEKLGGLDGIGVQFLTDCFEGRKASEQSRCWLQAAMRVLSELLPSKNLEEKEVRSYDQLWAVSELERPLFNDLLNTLVRKLFLVTPREADAEGFESDSQTTICSYQLAHDFLVPSIREWLKIREQQTSAGRARLTLDQCTAAWTVRRERRQLPTTLETVAIHLRTNVSCWSQEQREMMRAAVKHHCKVWGTMMALLVVVGFALRTWQSQHEIKLQRQQVRFAVELLQESVGSSVPECIENLQELPESEVLRELADRFATENPRHKLAVAFALAVFGIAETEYLVSRIDDIAPTDTANFVNALALDRDVALVKIKAAADQCTTEKSLRRKGKLAVAALTLGEVGIAADMCRYEYRPNPEQRTIFINEFPRWAWHLADRTLSLSQLAQRVADIQDSGLRSGLCLAVGSIPEEMFQQLIPEDLQSWKQLASRWFVEHSDSSTHSAAHWLLQQLRNPLPEVPESEQIRQDRYWFVNSVGMTMLKINPVKLNAEPNGQMKPPESEYWLASCEVTRGQFETFINDKDYQYEKPLRWEGFSETDNPTLQHPALQISLNDAIMYCNWLSRRESKTPAYQKTAKRAKVLFRGRDLPEWELVPNTNGYRLPSEIEWEYAARAGSITDWSSGSDRFMLVDYCQMFPSQSSAAVGTKLPNAWGFHDMHGNACEWCDGSDSEESSFRVLRGGAWHLTDAFCHSANNIRSDPDSRGMSYGFRLAFGPFSSQDRTKAWGIRLGR